MRITQPIVTSPAPRDVWRRLLARDTHALVDQTPDWLDCVCAAASHSDASRLYELPGSKQLLLPLVRRIHRPRALTMQASFPLGWGMGGLLTTGQLATEDVAAVWSDLAGLGVLGTSIRPNPLLADAWAGAKPSNVLTIGRLAHVLDLEGGFDRIWTKSFNCHARNAVRRAEHSGLSVECDTSGRLVPVFYDLLRRSVERWAGQQHEPLALARWRFQRRDPSRKFEEIAKRLGDTCRIWVASRAGQPVATLLVLQGKNAHASRSAMDRQLVGPTNANSLLLRLAIEDACRAGCRYFHLGESGASASLARFKSSFGARPYPYAEYRLERFPVSSVDAQVRGLVKRAIRFKDA